MGAVIHANTHCCQGIGDNDRVDEVVVGKKICAEQKKAPFHQGNDAWKTIFSVSLNLLG